MMKILRLLFLVLLTTIIISCSNKGSNLDEKPKTDKLQNTELIVEVENNNDYEGDFKIAKTSSIGQVILSEKGGWLAYDINIPVAGRYKVEISAATDADNPVNVWLEDYYDNKDGRTYNTTGNISIANTGSINDFHSFEVHGSPYNNNLHKMRLHVGEGNIAIDWIQFTLIQAHQITPSTLTQNMTGTDWSLVWSDEFEGTGRPDSTKWIYDIGNWGWGNSELQNYTENRAENSRLEAGNLIIEARKNDLGNKWTSARLTTRGKVSFLYGKIEYRAKVPSGKGNWAAGWTLGDNYVDELSWPYCGEIDIMESVGYEMNDSTGNGIAHASVHSGAAYFKLGNQPTGIVARENMSEAYHTYGMEWSPEGIKAYVDDVYYLTYENKGTELAWPFDKPQNIILNLAMGGGWGGFMGMDDTYTSQKLIIDYVRVYELQ
jgi:beta-glucanase (GH16 family)